MVGDDQYYCGPLMLVLLISHSGCCFHSEMQWQIHERLISLSGSALWNVVNCNDKIDNLNFKEIKRLFTTKNIVFMATSCVNSLLIMYAGVQR